MENGQVMQERSG